MFSAYNGAQQNHLARDQFNWQRGAYQEQFKQQQKILDAQMADRAAIIAANNADAQASGHPERKVQP